MNTTQSTIANKSLTSERLVEQNHKFRGTGGISSGNRSLGFVPAFQDMETGKVYRSCYADGQPAPFHMFEGLPSELLMSVDTDLAHASSMIKSSVIAGFYWMIFSFPVQKQPKLLWDISSNNFPTRSDHHP